MGRRGTEPPAGTGATLRRPMSGLGAPLLLALLAAAGGRPARAGDAPPPTTPAPESEAVKVSASLDVDEIAPGVPFTLATVFAVGPGWHIYWENPGDAGLATEARVEAPPGFEVGRVAYPVPERFTSPGDVVSYGYSGEAALLMTVTPPAALPADRPTRMKVVARWLACLDACVPGRLELSLEVPTAPSGRPIQPPDPARLARHRARLPLPAADLRWAEIRRRDAEGETELEVRMKGAGDVDLLPGKGLDVALREVRRGEEAGVAVLGMRLRAPAPGEVLTGVLKLLRDGRPEAYSIEVPASPGGGDPRKVVPP